MGQPNTHKRRRWLWILLSVFILVPISVFSVLEIVFAVNAVRPGQVHAPADIMRFKINSRPTTQTPVSQTFKKFKSFDEVIAASPNKAFRELYEDWKRNYTNEMDNGIYIETNNRRKLWPLRTWNSDEPLSSTQAAWLVANQAFIQKLERVATDGAIPKINNEHAAAICEEYHNDIPIPGNSCLLPRPSSDFYIDLGRILRADSRRLRESGDFTTAADRLIAMYALGGEINEPGFWSHIEGLVMQSRAGRELSLWLSTAPPSSELAASMRLRLAGSAIDTADFRDMVVIEYCFKRVWLVRELTGPRSNLWTMNKYEVFPNEVCGHLKEPDSIGALIGCYAKTGFRTISMKASAADVVDRSDAEFRVTLKEIDANDPAHENNAPYLGKFDFDWHNQRQRTRTNLAQFRVNLTGLDLASGKTTATEIDPYSNQPIKTVHEQNTELIYSIGPDLKDDRGAITYDPTNGTFSAGDIVLRVPKQE